MQDAVKVEQPSGPGKFEVPNWDAASQKKVRDALVVLGATLPDWRRAAGRRNEIDPVRHLIVTATGWGLNPDKDAIYLNVTPSKNDGMTIYKLNVKDVPVDGFWSISLYNAEGFFEPNNLNAYTLNNITAKKSDDGSVAVQFGGCDGKIPNCLPIVSGWKVHGIDATERVVVRKQLTALLYAPRRFRCAPFHDPSRYSCV